MLIDVLEYAAENRERIVGLLSEENSLFEKAKREWNELKIEPDECSLAGIDSSYNYIPYLGFYLYAVDSVSVDAEAKFVVEPKKLVGLGKLVFEESSTLVHDPRYELQSLCLDFECELALNSSQRSDMVMIDGSVLARYYDRREKKSKPLYEYAKSLMSVENIVFIAKTSTSNTILGGNMGDIYYFNSITSKSGFSSITYDRAGITVFYARLSDFSPCLRFEVPGRLSERETIDVLRKVCCNVVGGYPYELLIAHQICKVGDKDMDDIASTLGLEIHTGGREIIGE